jgi:quaternary ammonium compound-resistance protein SugE
LRAAATCVFPDLKRGHVLGPATGVVDRDGPALERKEGRMAWIVLFVAGLLEIVWSVAMKQSDGFTRLVPAAVSIAAMIGSVAALAFAMRTLPLGTAYTVWTGIGAVGAFAVGIVFLGEAASALRLAAATLIVAGLVLMKFASAE